MKIDAYTRQHATGEKPPVGAPERRRLTGTEEAGSGARPSALPPSDRLDLSPKAAEFARLRSRLDALPDAVREERIATLRARVAEGAYVIDAGRVADRMLANDAVLRLLAGPAR